MMLRTLFCGLFLFTSLGSIGAMEVGTNLWDVGWGRERNDPFVDGFKNVGSEALHRQTG